MRAAIVLAAGASRRFGRGNKLLAEIGGRAVLAHVIARARGAAGRVIVVTGHDRARVSRVARRGGVELVHAPDRARGLSASLAAGLARLRPLDREVLLFLGDMPFVPNPRRWRRHGADAVRPGTNGHPVLLSAAFLRSAALSGDRGLGPALARARVRQVGIVPGALADLDTPAALRRVRGSRWLIRALPPR